MRLGLGLGAVSVVTEELCVLGPDTPVDRSLSLTLGWAPGSSAAVAFVAAEQPDR